MYLPLMDRPLLFMGLDDATVESLLARARRRRFGNGEVVFHEGDPGASMQVIVRGHFALRVTTAQGATYMFRVFGPGDVFGRMAISPASAAVRDMTVVSLDQSETYELFRSQLDELRAAHPSVNDGLIAMAGLELRRVSERLLEALFVDADRRVRRRLLELGALYRDPETGLTVIPLSQEEVAEMAGTSRATVSRVMHEEEQRGTLSKRRRMIVLQDAEQLARWAGWPDGSMPAAFSR